MPFTASHVAAVLPLVRRGRWVSAGLVTGSMAPDLPSFVPLGLGHEQTHPLSAILWPDALLAIGLLLIWWVLLRPGLAPLWPAAAARSGPSGWRSAPTGQGPRRLLGWVGWLAASELVGPGHPPRLGLVHPLGRLRGHSLGHAVRADGSATTSTTGCRRCPRSSA